MGTDDLAEPLLGSDSLGEDAVRSRKQKIIFAMVIANGTVVSESYVNVHQTNLPQVMQRILTKLPEKKAMYEWDDYNLCVLVEGTMMFIAIVDKMFKATTAFAYLDAVTHRFKATYGTEIDNFKAYGCSDFDEQLKTQGQLYTNNPPSKAAKVLNQIEDVKGVLIQNIEAVIGRHEKIEILVEETDSLKTNSEKFRKGAKALKRKYIWKNLRMWLIVGGVVVLLVFILLLVLCNPDFSKCGNSGE